MSGKKEVEINIFESELVPPHRILSEKEKKALLAKYNAKLSQLPRILTTDPVVKALGAKVGDVIEITRSNPEIGEYKYYRVVVKPKKK